MKTFPLELENWCALVSKHIKARVKLKYFTLSPMVLVMKEGILMSLKRMQRQINN